MLDLDFEDFWAGPNNLSLAEENRKSGDHQQQTKAKHKFHLMLVNSARLRHLRWLLSKSSNRFQNIPMVGSPISASTASLDRSTALAHNLVPSFSACLYSRQSG